jgi:hypothetical protein
VGGSAAYNLVEDEGVALPQRTTLNFVGPGVTVTDVGGLTQVSIPGGIGGFGPAPPDVSDVAGSAGSAGTASRSDHTHFHGNLAGGSLHALASTHSAGFMSASDFSALAALSAGAPYVPTSRTIVAGNGLTGGGDLSADRTFDVVANADGSIVVNPNDIQVGVLATDAQHGSRGGGTQHAIATPALAGFMSAADKAKLDGLPNVVSTLLAETGQQSIRAVGPGGGWTVLGAVYFTSVPASVFLEAIHLVSVGLLTNTVHLYDTVAASVVGGSSLSTSNTTDTRQISANIAGALLPGRIYQFRARCTGGVAVTYFAVVRHASLQG